MREAIDFCRYYAAQAREKFAEAIQLPGPTGERNTLSLHGRGVFVCISPWNFPLIFAGQPRRRWRLGTRLSPNRRSRLRSSRRRSQLLHQVGVPADALCFLPGDGRSWRGASRRSTLRGRRFHRLNRGRALDCAVRTA